ncbi:MAG: glycosyltransferase family 39 protein [bacterium]|nr:glycosyltransferase family 39 protein [bacterium]
MKKFIIKYRGEILLGLFLALLFFLTRLIHLTEMPIFTDEAIYLRWAQIAKNDASWRFISLTDGKQPLFVWLTMIMMIIINDPIVAGRLVSVAAGFVTMVGMGFLGYELFGRRRVGFLAAILYLVSPFAMVYDRMALMDSLLGTFTVWCIYLIVLLVRNLRLDLALILGALLGGGVLTKT